VSCQREGEVFDALASDCWEDERAADTRQHAAACVTCGELVELASLIRDDYEAAIRSARVPASSQVWWRAVARTRLDAQRAATQPIKMLNAVASACAAGLTCAAVAWISPWVPRISWLNALLAKADAAAAGAAVVSGVAFGQTLTLVVALTACALFAPVTIYLLLTDD
jgi:hypothetical protein